MLFVWSRLLSSVPFVFQARRIVVAHCQEWEDLSEGDSYPMFAVVRGCASIVATTGLWLVACGRSRAAIEQAEQLLLYPLEISRVARQKLEARITEWSQP